MWTISLPSHFQLKYKIKRKPIPNSINCTTAPSAGQQTREELIVKYIDVQGKNSKLHTDDYGSITSFSNIQQIRCNLYSIQKYCNNFSVSTQVASFLFTTSNQNVTNLLYFQACCIQT